MTSNLRILHVLEATLGGTLRYLNDIIDASDANRHELAIAYATERAEPGLTEMLERARSEGWQTFHVEMRRAVSPRNDLTSVFALRKTIQGFQPDVLHCHSSKAGAIGRITRLISASYPKIVYSPHAVAANLGKQYLVIEKLLRPLTARYSAVSESERDELLELGMCKSSHVSIVYPTIDTQRFEVQGQTSARSLLSLPQDGAILLGIGRLVEQKNTLFFLKVVKELTSRRPNIKAIWLGDGELRPKMEAEIIALGLAEVVTLVGWQPDVRPYIAACSVLLSSSRYESFGYMVAETLAMERPVVASDITGTRDIMQGELAKWLYAPEASKGAVDLILALLDDRVKSAMVGSIGREQMKRRFNCEAMREALDKVYEAAVNG